MKTITRHVIPTLLLATASHQASAACNYDDADLFNGWGWNPNTRMSCPPRSTVAPLANLTDASGISSDGRFVVYETSGPAVADAVYLHDRDTNETKIISVSAGGQVIDGHDADISLNGQFVAFFGTNEQLSASGQDPSFGQHGIYVHEVSTGQTTKALGSVPFFSSRLEGGDPLLQISNSGQYIAYRTFERGLESVRILDRFSGETVLASIDNAGNPIDARLLGQSSDASKVFLRENGVRTNSVFVYGAQSGGVTELTFAFDLRDFSTNGNGDFSAFSSSDPNLVDNDTNNASDTFVFDSRFNTISRVSVSSIGNQFNNTSFQGTFPATRTRIGQFGNYVSFVSAATDLVNDGGSSRTYLHNRATGETTRLNDRSGTFITANGVVVNYDAGGDVYSYNLGASSQPTQPIQPTATCVDSDGDGWGWDGTASCRVGVTPVNPVMPECIDTDPLNDGWGWNGSTSCRVAPTTLVCVDSPPVNDGWGWNGIESCRIGQ